MKKTTLLFLSLAVILGISSCKDDNAPTLGAAPTEADAAFTYVPSAANTNIIEFTATNAGFTYSWDFDNGATASTREATAEYPTKGSYDVTLTVFNSGGSASSTQTIVIAEDDATLLNNPIFTFLTGGAAGGGTKTWVIDSTRQAHLGVGPVGGTWWEWWDADPLIKSGSGLYSDKYTFTLQGFKFDHYTGGSVFVKTGSQGQFPGAYENSDDWTAPYTDKLGETWTIIEGDEDTTIRITGDGFLGMYTGVREYKIVTLNENELTIRYIDAADATTAWYARFVPEDFPVDGGGGGGEDPVNTSIITLPINFETSDLTDWETFGNNALAIIDNPDASGINTSDKVLEVVHGDETWAGQFVNLKDMFDFTGAAKTITLKVWAPETGVFRIKMENFAKPTDFVEKDVNVTVANTWQEISIDFSEAGATNFDRLVLFPGWKESTEMATSGTFYIDDIEQK